MNDKDIRRPALKTLAILLVLLASAAIVRPCPARAKEETRTATRKKVSGKGWVTLSNGKRCHDYKEDIIEITFPVNGGKIEGTRVWSGHSADNDPKNPVCSESSGRQTISGDFSGGDGGKITGEIANPKRGSRYKLTGDVHARGEAFIRWSKYHKKKPVQLTFSPFAACNPDLSKYTEADQEVIAAAFKGVAGRKVVRDMTDTINQFSRKKTEKGLRKAGIGTQDWIETVNATDLIGGFLEGQWVKADKVLSWVGNVAQTLTFLEAAEAASAGDYEKLAVMAALEYVGSYGNAATVLIALGQAAKADWDAYAKRMHEKFYRKFYEQLYYDGSRPRPLDKIGKRDRLEKFMEEAIATLDWGGANMVQFKGVLRDFAYYSLEQKFSTSDFNLTASGKLKKAAGPVLVALFNAYESTYINDARAEAARRIAIAQSNAIKAAGETAEQVLRQVEAGDYSKVWPSKEEHDQALCHVISQLKKKGKIKLEKDTG